MLEFTPFGNTGSIFLSWVYESVPQAVLTSSADYFFIFDSHFSYTDNDERSKDERIDRYVQAEINHAVNGDAEKTNACAENSCPAKRIRRAQTLSRPSDKQKEKPSDQRHADDSAARQ